MWHSVNPKHWILGVLLAFLIIWSISFLFVNTLAIYIWSPDVGRMIRQPGSVYKERSEGWGTSHFGQLDVVGVDDISKNEMPTVAIWGNSYVEACQVEQWERMQEVLNGMWRADGIKSLTAFGVGDSGESVSDYYFKIPRYEKTCPTIIAHFIVLAGMQEILPDQSFERSVFQSKPAYRIIEHNRELEYQRIKTILGKYRLDFLWLPTRAFIKDTKLRFSLGSHKSGLQSTKVAHEPEPEKAFAFFLNALRHETTKPIIFIYCPSVPTIGDGKVDFKDHDADIVYLFAAECRNNGIGFIDMTQDFCNYYRQTGAFPRGFANSRPSEGHFNANGHRLVAKAIYRAWLSVNGRFDAIHAN